MRIAIFLCAWVVACHGAGTGTANFPKVTTTLGEVKGSTMTSRLGKQIYAFRGMRYAQAPVGELRFKAPVPAASWTGVFDASEESVSCPRPAGQLKSEDCLRLNVYTTKLPASAKAASVRDGTKKPVMVFLHPGGFYGFSGQSYLWGPQYLLDQDIVLVTINFRLGALGFLATGDAHAPGNFGLKDQVEALRWVKKNIAAFGGDPNSVTLCGYSAGSWSVILHMISPMSKDLFHRAIAMSGSPTKGPPMPGDMIGYSKKQARLLHCPDDTNENMVRCLRTKNADDMAATRSEFNEWQYDPIRVWGPVVEPVIPGQERFIIDQPQKLISEGKFHQVPLLAGVTRDEFAYLTMQEIVQARQGNDTYLRDLDANWNRIAPISFSYERDTPKSRMISQDLRNFYFQGRPINLQTVQGHADCYADALVESAMHRLVHLVAPLSKQPVYYYRFVYQGRYSHGKWPDTQQPYGVTHHDDLLYLFYISLFPYFDKDAPEIPTVELMTAMWANFAKTGAPIPNSGARFAGVTWDRFTTANKKYMEIGTSLTLKTNLHPERMALYDRLFPVNPTPGSLQPAYH